MFVKIIAPSIWCFAILVSVAFVQCTDHLTQNGFGASNSADKSLLRNMRAADKYEFLPYGGTAAELLDTSHGFLAGEDTPVWLANRNTLQEVVFYKKLANGVVKRAIDDWKSTHNTRRARRSTDEHTNFTRSGRSTDAKVLYPSVLAVLDYGGAFSAGKPGQSQWINDGILYALSFWNSVDLQLRYINDPSVRIRLAGIILVRNRISTPYIYNHSEEWVIDSERTVYPMMAYWKRLAEINPDFNTNAYDTIATMTGSSQIFGEQFKSALGAADTRTPCLGNNKGINGIIFHDYFGFEGVRVAVHLMARILGAKVNGPCLLFEDDIMKTLVVQYQDRSYGRTWSTCTLEEIGTNLLEHGSCMEKPKEYHKPGKPVEIILPGQFLPITKYCQAFVGGSYDCFEHMKEDPCGQIFCSPNVPAGKCRSMGQEVYDGTWCGVDVSENRRKICLDGRCVADPILA